MARNQAVTWEEIVSTQLPGDVENWDAEDSQSAVDPQFEDAHIEEEEDEEQVVIESVTKEELEEPVAGKPLTQEFERNYHRNCKSRRDANSHWGG